MKQYRTDIDGLRAVAVLGVILFHAAPSTLPGGFIGVDVFFVISGYLITSIISDDLKRGAFSVMNFYARRVRRIFPTLLAVLVSCLLFGWFALLADEYRQLSKHTVASAGFFVNFIFWREVDYFDNIAETKPLLHLWSLSIEEQFYLVWPWLMLWLARQDRRWTFWIGILASASFVYGCMLAVSDTTAAFYSPLSRFWELALGGLATKVQWVGWSGRGRVRIQNVLSLAGLLLIGCGFVVIDKNKAFPGLWALLPALGATFLLVAGAEALVNRTLLARRAFVLIGLISYPLYLWHWPLLSFARIVESQTPAPGFRALMVAAAFFLAWITWQCVERPLRHRRASRALVLMLAAAMLSVGSFARVVMLKGGLPDRVADFEQRSARFHQDNLVEESDAQCQQVIGLGSLRYCRLYDPLRPATIALMGDSHANRLFDPLSATYAKQGYNLLQLGGAGCVPYWDMETGRGAQFNECDQLINSLLTYLERSSSIRSVLLLHRGPLHLTGIDPGRPPGAGGHFFLRDNLDPSSDADSAMRSGMERTVARLTAAGKRVTLLVDWPELEFDPRACLSRPFSWRDLRGNECRLDRTRVEQRNQRYLDIIRAVGREHLESRIIDMQVPLCDADSCYVVMDGVILYRDADHLNRSGAQAVVDSLREQFLNAVGP